MRKLKYFSISFSILFITELNAQIDLSTTGDGDLRVNRSTAPLREKRVLTSEESTNLYDEYRTGLIFLRDSSSLKGSLLYDFYEDIVSFRQANREHTITSELALGFIVFDDSGRVTNVFESVSYPRMNARTGFLEVMNEGDFRVLVEREFLVKSGDYNPAIQVGEGDRVVLKYNYYAGYDETIYRINSKKALINIIDVAHVDDVKSFIRMNKLKFEIKDLISVANYINRLNK